MYFVNLIFVYIDIQTEKIELIKLIADMESEKVLKKIKDLLKSEKKMDETDRILTNPTMVKRLDESIQQIKDGKGIKIFLDDVFKTEKAKKAYNPEFVAKMKRGEEDIKAGRTIKIDPAGVWDLK